MTDGHVIRKGPWGVRWVSVLPGTERVALLLHSGIVAFVQRPEGDNIRDDFALACRIADTMNAAASLEAQRAAMPAAAEAAAQDPEYVLELAEADGGLSRFIGAARRLAALADRYPRSPVESTHP